MTGSSRKLGIGARIGFGLLAILAIGIAYVVFVISSSFLAGPAVPRFTTAQEDHSVFYRLKASYMHKDERIEFDIVAACNVRITGYADGGSSHDVIMAPPFFVKATKDGGAIAQRVPSACRGETTENGQVPKDLLPGAIWFDDVEDLSIGIAHVFEDGYDNPNSRLKFLGATISKATRAEWQQFFATIGESLIPIERYYKSGKIPRDFDEEDLLAEPWNRTNLAKYYGYGVQGCRAYKRFRIVDETERAEVYRHWPSSHPQYWTQSPADLKDDSALSRLTRVVHGFNVGDAEPTDFFGNDDNGSRAFPTRTGGGMIGKSVLPPEIYSVRRSDGIPWLTKKFIKDRQIEVDLNVNRNLGRGLFYCYSILSGSSPITERFIPDYWTKSYVVRVDDIPVHFGVEADPYASRPPQVIFERDEFVFISLSFL